MFFAIANKQLAIYVKRELAFIDTKNVNGELLSVARSHCYNQLMFVVSYLAKVEHNKGKHLCYCTKHGTTVTRV